MFYPSAQPLIALGLLHKPTRENDLYLARLAYGKQQQNIGSP